KSDGLGHIFSLLLLVFTAGCCKVPLMRSVFEKTTPGRLCRKKDTDWRSFSVRSFVVSTVRNTVWPRSCLGTTMSSGRLELTMEEEKRRRLRFAERLQKRSYRINVRSRTGGKVTRCEISCT